MAKKKPDSLADLYAQQQEQLSSPAAPSGLQQQAQAGASDSSLAAMYQEQGYVPTAQSWYTGANTEGTDSGWDTEFSEAFHTGANKALEEGTLDAYFES